MLAAVDVSLDTVIEPPPPADQAKVPEPLVDNTCPLLPSAAGRVHVTFDAILAAALNAT
jgi:hypothetical protein